MRKLILILFVVSLSVLAYDTSGKFGMGIRFWGSPIITFSSIKYSLNNLFEIEPSVGYYKWSYDYDTYEYSNDLLFISLINNIKVLRASRSNLMLKIGGVYATFTTSYGDDESYKNDNYAFLYGIGLEHFINANFSVNVGALSGFWKSSDEDTDYSSTLNVLGSQIVDFSFQTKTLSTSIN